MITVKRVSKFDIGKNSVLIVNSKKDMAKHGLSAKDIQFVEAQNKKKASLVKFISSERILFILNIEDKDKVKNKEAFRKAGDKIQAAVNSVHGKEVQVINETKHKYAAYCLAEGIALGNYQFLKYFKDKQKMKNSLATVKISDKAISPAETKELNNTFAAIYNVRDLVNEPLSFLTAEQLSKEIKRTGKEAGFTVQVFNKKKIESLKMGGLLAVNRGSIDPPTFTIMEHKPKKPVNKKPIVLVGKGVVYDTGGLSLKPTANSMDFMKSDMGGAAIMIGTMQMIALNNLPLHVIGLIPATDNRPGLNAYAPGDVIEMHSGKTVEVLNTDAEGRMCLADALSYADKYKPELVFDAATLTGSAARAVGPLGISYMGTADNSVRKELEKAGEDCYERLVEFPFWEEYGDQIKSSIADIKNVGGPYAGMVTAGKFLEHFTNYPWIHLDVAGTAFYHSKDSYRGKGGTGFGVRMLYQFLKGRANVK